MSPRRDHLRIIGAACAMLGLAASGCGSSGDEPKGKPLPRAVVADLQKRLDEVERRYEDGTVNFNAGACNDIQEDSYAGEDRGIDQILSELPAGVDPELRKAVADSFENLRTLTEEGCSETKPPPATDTQPEPDPPEPEPDPVPEPTVPEPTVPEPTVPEPTVPEPTPPETDPGNGGALPPGQGGKVPGKGNGGGAEAPPGLEQKK